MTEEAANLSTIRAYLQALQDGAIGDALPRYFTPDAVQVELPNRLNPNGARSDLPTLLKRAEHGQKLLRNQSYVIQAEVAHGQRVAVFFELKDGRICSQRNYDCFEP